MEIIKIKDGRYDEYEKLLLERDRYRQEADSYLRLYIHTFGDLLTAVFQKKIACIEKKKTLSFCMMYINRGESVDIQEMNSYIAREMASYKQQLDDMIADNALCKKLKAIPEDEAMQIRQLYRRIARRLHPDINPLTAENEALSELWNRVALAYHCNDLKELAELEILAEHALNDLGQGSIEITIPDITEKITALYAEIEEIRTTDPYRYKFLLDNPALIEEKKQALQAELAEYEQYEAELQAELKKIISEGGTFIWTN